MEQKFETWAVVELFGHNKIAGLCSEQNIAGTNMLRVDVPETDSNPSFTRFVGGASIYAINPVTEEMALFMAFQLNEKPIDGWDIRKYEKKALAQHNEPTTEDVDLDDVFGGM